MRKAFISIFFAFLTGAVAAAQAAPAAQPQAGTGKSATQQTTQETNAKRLAPGSVIPVQLTKTLDAKKAKTGEKVVAKVSQDLKNTSGDVIVPKDTQVIGHVTEAQARNKQQHESELAITFDRAVEKGGIEVQMPMSIQAVIGQQNNAQQNGNSTAQPEQTNAGESGLGNMQRPGMGGNNAPPPATSDMGANPPNSSGQQQQRPHITAKTEGVVGIPNLKLQSQGNNAQGSLLTSDKKNVKLDSGTMMLLKVDQY